MLLIGVDTDILGGFVAVVQLLHHAAYRGYSCPAPDLHNGYSFVDRFLLELFIASQLFLRTVVCPLPVTEHQDVGP
jgi:hypothetical protein